MAIPNNDVTNKHQKNVYENRAGDLIDRFSAFFDGLRKNLEIFAEKNNKQAEHNLAESKELAKVLNTAPNPSNAPRYR